LFSLRIAPWAARKTLNWIKNNYGNVSVYVSSGISDDMADIGQYQIDYVNEVLKGTSHTFLWYSIVWTFSVRCKNTCGVSYENAAIVQ